MIKTDKVTVPTDQIIDSQAKLLDTTKTLVLGNGILRLVKQAPDDSFLRRLSTKSLLEPDGYLERMKEQLDNYVAFGNKIELIHLIINLSQHARQIGAVAFISPTFFYEALQGFKMRKSLEAEQKRSINWG